MGAGISLAVFKAVERGVHRTTLAAGMAMAEPHGHDVFQTSRIIREALEELPNVHFASVMFLVHRVTRP